MQQGNLSARLHTEINQLSVDNNRLRREVEELKEWNSSYCDREATYTDRIAQLEAERLEIIAALAKCGMNADAVGANVPAIKLRRRDFDELRTLVLSAPQPPEASE